MGIANKKLGASQCAKIAEGLFTVKHRSGDEMHGLCPFHDDKTPSFSYNPVKDAFNCLGCAASGDLVVLWCHQHGYAKDDKEGFKAFCREFGISGDGGGRDRPPGSGPPKKDDPADLDEIFASMPPLTDAWIGWLKMNRGWSRDVIERLDIRLQTCFQKKTGEVVKIKKPERIAIPIKDADGHVRNIRLYKPADRREGEAKIISWGKDCGAARLFPAAPLPDVSPVILCEGESDAICAMSHGLNAITQTGKPKKWSREHAAVFEGVDLVIAYDADQAGQMYANDYAAPHLARVTQSLKSVVWPEFMGLRSDGTWPSDHGEDLTDFFVKHNKTIDDWWQLVSEATVVDILPHISSQAREFFAESVTGRLSFRPRLLAEKIMEKFQIMSDPESGLVYRWNGRYWQLFFEDHLKAQAIQLLGYESQKSRVEDAVYQIKNLSTLPDGRRVNDNKDLVCVKNGMLDLKTWDIHPHDRDYFATFELPVTFDPDTDRVCNRWLDYLHETIQTEAVIMQVQEFFGYCLTKDVAWAKSMFLIGPGSDGKSVMLKILRDMVGAENTSSVSFNELENQFLRASLYQKAVNFSTETQQMALESEYFKKISSGDPINAAFKHKDSFEFAPFCKLVFSANRLPRVLDNSDGFYRRVLPVQFKRQFREGDPDTDPWLYKKLQAELSEIFSWSLVGLKRLWEQERFTDCRETQESLLGYRRLNNPVLCFIEDACAVDDHLITPKEDLYGAYRGYCYDNGYKPYSRENFFRELYAARDNLELIRPRVENKRIQSIKGIGLLLNQGGEQ